MHNRKHNLKISSSNNDAYESDTDQADERRMSSEIGSIPEETNFDDRNSHVDQHAPHSVQPTINPFSGDNVPKTFLSGIPEEMGRVKSKDETRDKEVSKMGFQNMSLSNFKMLQKNANEIQNDNETEMKRNASHASIIHMKQIDPEPVQTGRNFRKTSTFVIFPKNLNGEERLSIKIVDKQNVPELFIELDCLYLNPVTNNYYWIEKFRWIKFEEDYNQECLYFNSPHLSSLTFKHIKDFRNTFSKGEIIFDCSPETFTNLLNNIADSISNTGSFSETEMLEIREALMLKHKHAGERLNTSSSEISMYRYDNENQRYQQHHELGYRKNSSTFSKLESIQRKLSHARMEGKLETGTESFSVQVGALNSLDHTFSLFVRLITPVKTEGILEVDCPLRFVYLVFGPKNKEDELIEIGRVFAVMMSNIEFREVGYSANTKEELLEATKLFVKHSALVPLNKLMSHDTLAAMLPHLKHYFNGFISEQNQKLFEEMKKEMALQNHEITVNNGDYGNEKKVPINALMASESQLSEFDNKRKELIQTRKNNTRQFFFQFCPPFRNLYYDVKGLRIRYGSDFRDAFTKENAPIVFTGILFIYFVVMAPAITFGALLNAVNPRTTVSMMLLASGFFQFFCAFFGGQPFEVIGITGPVFSVEKVLGILALSIGIELGAMRFWIGIYVAILGIVTITFNGIVILKHVRRSVEEIYNFLVCVIYILSALFNMFQALPYTITPLNVNGTNANVIVTERLKFGIGGANLFLAFFMANFCLILVGIKKGTFYRRQLRKYLGALNVPLGIILIIAMNQIFFRSFSLPTLNVPPSNAVNFSLWFNIPTASSIMSLNSQAHGYCFLIGLCLFAIIICEISCNATLATRAERKLLKPSFFSLNFLYILIFFPIISGTLGWPFVSGGTVRSHVHCMAVTLWSLRLPGVPPKVTGAIEQRISGSVVGLLVLLSVFLGSALQYIPMAAMYGMFLYMGIVGSIDLWFIRRFINLLRRRKYWKEHTFLKDIPTFHIAIFVSVQVFFMGVLILLNCISQFTSVVWTPLLFPWTILAFALVRGYLMPLWPRLNTHLSKMDKKHPVTLYSETKTIKNVVVTVDQNGGSIKVVETVADNKAYEDSECGTDKENEDVVD